MRRDIIRDVNWFIVPFIMKGCAIWYLIDLKYFLEWMRLVAILFTIFGNHLKSLLQLRNVLLRLQILSINIPEHPKSRRLQQTVSKLVGLVRAHFEHLLNQEVRLYSYYYKVKIKPNLLSKLKNSKIIKFSTKIAC